MIWSSVQVWPTASRARRSGIGFGSRRGPLHHTWRCGSVHGAHCIRSWRYGVRVQEWVGRRREWRREGVSEWVRACAGACVHACVGGWVSGWVGESVSGLHPCSNLDTITWQVSKKGIEPGMKDWCKIMLGVPTGWKTNDISQVAGIPRLLGMCLFCSFLVLGSNVLNRQNLRNWFFDVPATT